MKIERLKLVNFIGIMHGMEKDTFEIDFSKGNNKIVMFRGKNGSGKSTIVGSLTPFKQSTDNRTQLILEGKDGRKEIDIRHKGHLYEIVHIYPNKGTSQSFIKKDGVELNENGGVKSCEDIICRELGITKDYFKIGKIGSNTKNFIDLSTAERKKYIGTFLDIEEIQKKFDIVKEKRTVLNRDLKSVAADLGRFDDKAVVETKIKTLTDELKDIEKQLSTDLPQKGALEESIRILNQNLSEIDSNKISKDKADKEADLLLHTELIKSLKEEIDVSNPTETNETLQKEIAKITTDISVNESEKVLKNSLITTENNKITELTTELSNLGNPEDIKKLEELMKTSSETMAKLKTVIRSNPRAAFVKNMQTEKKDINRYLLKFSEFVKFIEKYFTDLQKKTINNVESNIELFLRNDCEESFNRQVNQSKLTLTAKQSLLTDQEKERSGLEVHRCQAETLEQRPAECSIDTCPFIAEALKWKNIGELIKNKDAEIQQSKKDLEDLGTKADNLQELLDLFKSFKIALEAASPRENSILTEFLKEKTLIEWVLGPLSEFQKESQAMISDIMNATSDFEKFLEASRTYKNSEISKNKLENLDNTLKEKYEKDLNAATALKEKLEKELADLVATSNNLNKLLAEKQALQKKYDSYLTSTSKIASINTMLSGYRKNLDLVSKWTTELNDATEKLNEVKARINTNEKLKAEKNSQLTTLSSELGQILALVNKNELLQKQFKPINLIYKILSPSDGLQRILQNVYLKVTERIANDLLDTAFNGDFKIKFNNDSADEFLINVQTKENVKNDISLASQGEVALTTISISLALIQQALGDYNILALDEIDGPLDADNRENFINILMRQIDKLGIEQVFVISHNNAFDTCPLDLVLLKNSDVDTTNSSFMQNKTVIFSI